MAQRLKEEVKQAIVKSAKKEFLEKGYKNASMRNIAKKCNMTVGNLYRYFKNKESINLYIVGPTFVEIDSVLKKVSNKNFSVETRVYDFKPDIKQIYVVLDELSDKLVDIYSFSKDEFNILMLHSRLNEKIITWFKEIIISLISKSFVIEGLNNDYDVFALAYAEAAFKGIQIIFKNAESDSTSLKVLLRTYLRSFIYMLDNDIRRFVQ